MTKKLLHPLLVASLVLGLATTALAEEKKKIVVGDPKTSWAQSASCQGYAPNYAETISASMRSRILETGAYRVVDRGQMQKILREHEMSMTGLIDPSKAKVLGQFLQADLVMGTELLCHPNSVDLVINLVDIETAEIIYSKTYSMKDLSKMNRAIKDIADLMKKYAKTGKMDSAGKTEDLMMVDSKALRDASEYIIRVIEGSVPRVSATVEEVNANADTIKVKVRGSSWAGLRLKVKRNDEDIGELFLKKSGTGSVEAGTTGEISAFEEGDQGTTEEFKPKIAVGFIEDEDEANEKMVDMFKEGLMKEMSQAEKLTPADDSKTEKVLERMGNKSSKKDLEKLFKEGVDLLITGRFSGQNGNRRIDFEVLSTFDGKRVTKIKYDSRL